MRKWRILAMLFLAVGVLLWVGQAQAVHKSGLVFRCTLCHAPHQIDDQLFTGATTGTAYRLLKSGGKVSSQQYVSGFCLECHDQSLGPGKTIGAGETIPYVNNTNTKPTTMGAGGFFKVANTTIYDASLNTNRMHALNFATITVPAGSTAQTNFGCISCHSHHGTGSSDRTGIGPSESGVNVDAFRNLKRASTDILAAEAASPDYQTTSYTSGIADFCKRCHNLYTAGLSTGFHPAETESMSGGLVDSGWTGSSDDYDSGLDSSGKASIFIGKLAGSGSTGKPTCLTCHYVHGGKDDVGHKHNLRWNMMGATADYNSNATAFLYSTKNFNELTDPDIGCQLCHNR